MHKTIAIVGQPNSGTSSLFNVLSDIKSNTSNFAGDSFDTVESMVDFYGITIRIVDLPGVYSLNPSPDQPFDIVKFLFENKIDAVIDVVDSTILSRSLELTIELVELGVPMVVALNMTDEAECHGLVIATAC
jgi:ferrous iron transport protein B